MTYLTFNDFLSICWKATIFLLIGHNFFLEELTLLIMKYNEAFFNHLTLKFLTFDNCYIVKFIFTTLCKLTFKDFVPKVTLLFFDIYVIYPKFCTALILTKHNQRWTVHLLIDFKVCVLVDTFFLIFSWFCYLMVTFYDFQLKTIVSWIENRQCLNIPNAWWFFFYEKSREKLKNNAC